MTENVTRLHERTEQKFMVGQFVNAVLAEIAGDDIQRIDPTADAATMSVEMDRLLGDAMTAELTVRELLDAAVSALKEMAESGAGK